MIEVNNGCKGRMEEFTPVICMVFIQIVLSGVNIVYKLALNDGMNVTILVAYRYIFAATFLCPLAFFLERNRRPPMTWKVLLQTFGCGLFGGTLSQNMYVASMKMTSATFATAMMNLVPALTFILSVLFRLEKLGINTAAGKAKVVGTVVGIAGAMAMTFYKGAEIKIWSTTINLLKPSNAPHQSAPSPSNPLQGAVLAFASCISISVWMIIQAKMGIAYPCPYSTTALMCFMGAVQGTIYVFCLSRDLSLWRLGFNVRLLTVSYSGVVASGLIFSLLAWIIGKKGPLFASIFNPLMLVLVALLGSLLLNEKLYLGSIFGTILIIIGLYMVLWGKGKEVAARVGDVGSQSIKAPSESLSMSLSMSIRETMEVMVVDGIPISRNTSLARNGSMARITSFARASSQVQDSSRIGEEADASERGDK